MPRQTAIIAGICVGLIFSFTSILILRVSPFDISLMLGMFAGTIVALGTIIMTYIENTSNSASPILIMAGLGICLLIAVLPIVIVSSLQPNSLISYYTCMNGVAVCSLPIILFGMAALRSWLKI